MNRTICFLALAILTMPALYAQTQVKAPGHTVNVTAPAPKSNEDLNIQAYIQLLRSDINKAKSQIVSNVMQLDAQQAAAFWPIYKDFQADYAKIGDQIIDLVKTYVNNYDNLSNETADQCAMKLLDIEQQRNELKRTYYAKFKAALNPVIATEFLQVENQIEKLLDLQIASELPVAGTAGK